MSSEPEKFSAHKEAMLAWSVNLVGALMPIWLGCGVYGFFSKWRGQWEVFYQNGEFYLYSAAFLSAAAFVFYKDIFDGSRLSPGKRKIYDLHSCTLIVMVITAVLSAVFSGLLRASMDIFSNNPTAGATFVKWSSLTMFVFSAAMFYWSLLIQGRKEPDLKVSERSNMKDLNAAFDKLPGK